MKASDLRIGNLVKINNGMLIETEGEIYKVSGFNARFDISFPESTGTISLDHTKSLRTYSQFDEFIEPIKLTEEMLLKFGAIKVDSPNEQGYIIGIYRLFANSLGEINFCFFYFGDWYQHIQFAHELQNLYKLLSGEELTFKL